MWCNEYGENWTAEAATVETGFFGWTTSRMSGSQRIGYYSTSVSVMSLDENILGQLPEGYALTDNQASREDCMYQVSVDNGSSDTSVVEVAFSLLGEGIELAAAVKIESLDTLCVVER